MLQRAAFLFVTLLAFSPAQSTNPGPLRFRIKLAPEAASEPVAGRMLVFMTNEPGSSEVIDAGFEPGSTWVAALEFESIAPGQTVEFDPGVAAYPKPFSQAKPGRWQFMALLDRDHDYSYTGRDAGDLYGPVVEAANINPASTEPVELALTKHGEAHPDPRRDDIKVVEYESPSLTAFWGRPVTMRAAVVLPPGYDKEVQRQYPAVYFHHGFQGSYRDAWWQGIPLLRQMAAGKIMPSVMIFLDGSCPGGDHEFADSVNNGPWGRALTQEFVPYLEHEFRLIAKPSARFTTGHSSGGWASLWAQITYPDFYGGTWSTAPDPVDFRSFTGFNATPGSKDNAYRKAGGNLRNLMRAKGKDLVSLEDFAHQEEVLGEYGGAFSSFEWVFSPHGPGGRPMKLFNRVTGVLDPQVTQAWQKYDIRLSLDRDWERLGPKLKGKLHIICGAEDTFHLEEAVNMLCAFLKEKGSNAACEIVPGRDHMDLYNPYKTYPEGLSIRIAKEMQAKFEEAARH